MKDPKESFQHYTAKILLAGWLKDCEKEEFCNFADAIYWRRNWGVCVEYPLPEDGENWVWGERDWWEGDPNKCPNPSWPDYKWMKNNHKGNYKIADIVILHKGSVSYIIEIVHKHAISPHKMDFYRQFYKCATILQIPAQWVMDWTDFPTYVPKEFFIK